MSSLLSLSYSQTVILGSSLLALLAGMMGSFSYVKGDNLLGDAISHAALPGIALAFILYPSQNIFPLLLGGAASGLVAMAFILAIEEFSKLKTDTALALILSVFFGLGMVLMAWIQKSFGSQQAGLESFIFGQAASLMKKDLYGIFFLSLFCLLIVIANFPFFKLLSFDPVFFQSLGLPLNKHKFLLNLLYILVIIFGLKSVGVVLMSALLIGPPSIARLWTENFSKMLILSSLVGGGCGLAGTLLSIELNLPTGPSIVLVLMVVVFLNLLFAPKKGLWAQKKDQRKIRIGVEEASLYHHIVELKGPDGWTEMGAIEDHKKFQKWGKSKLRDRLDHLLEEGKVEQIDHRLRQRKESDL